MNNKPKFQLPETKLSVVIWFRGGIRNEQLITTPANNDDLINTMLMKYKVGYGEIRAVKAVNLTGSTQAVFTVGSRFEPMFA